MARRPQDAVQFTFESAERIADVVRAAELATPQGKPLTFEARFPDRMPKQVRAATFSGSWVINSNKVVQFSNAPTATANVTNLTWPINFAQPPNTPCVVGKEGNEWYLVCPKVYATTVTVVETIEDGIIIDVVKQITYVKDVSLSGGFNAESCSLDLSLVDVKDTTYAIDAYHEGPLIVTTATAMILTLRPVI